MSEYFAWINVDKRERLEMGAFGGSFEAAAPCWVGNYDIDAVCTLLSGRWRGDTIAYLGDYCTNYWPDESPEALAYRAEESPVFLEYAEDNFEDITGLFVRARGLTYAVFTETDYIEVPYEGPFELEIAHCRYVVNHSKKLFYDRTATPLRCVAPHGLGIEDTIVRFEPFPALFTKDSRLRLFCNHKNKQFEKDWVGDFVEAIDDGVPDGYLDVSSFYDYWDPSLIADDATIAEAMNSERYKTLVNAGRKQTDALKALLPSYVLRGEISEPMDWPAISTC